MSVCRQAVESSGGPSEIECRWIADLLGDYLDGSLPRHTRELIDFHIDRCPPCVAFINTYRGTIDAVRKLGDVETATGTPVTDEIASRRVCHRVGGCESCGTPDAALSRDPALAVERVSTRGLPWPRLRRVIGFIQDNMIQQLTLMDLSTVVHMSPYHFARLFKQSTGVPPHRFVLGQRIARASVLLRDARVSIGEIARLVGFRTPSHFATAFRRMTGLAPSEYRSRWRCER
jgi:transcriptional regulator GlxA family with amidase domain